MYNMWPKNSKRIEKKQVKRFRNFVRMTQPSSTVITHTRALLETHWCAICRVRIKPYYGLREGCGSNWKDREREDQGTRRQLWKPEYDGTVFRGKCFALQNPAATAAAAAKLLQSCPTLCDPIDGSPSDSTIPRILQARTLERVAISFSNAWKWKVKVKVLSRVQLLATPWTAAYQAPPSMGFSRQEYWSGMPLPSPSKPSPR